MNAGHSPKVGMFASRFTGVDGLDQGAADVGWIAQVIAALKPDRDWFEAVAACIRYCEANRGRMRCDLCRERGLPIGSGIAESTCKHIVGNRFKKSGCCWSKAGANALLAAGCCLENMRWPDFLEWRACRAAAA